MCWNQEISWITFFLGTICNIVLASLTQDNKTIVWYLLFQSIIFVQLGEALIWGDPNGGTRSKIGTIISFLGVWLHPIIAAIILTVIDVNPYYKYIIYVIVLLYILVSIPHILRLQNDTYVPLVCGDGKKHIDFIAWGDSAMSMLYMICVFLLTLFAFTKYPYVCSYLLITLFISQIYYKRVFSSIWCWFAVFTPLVCFFAPHS